MKNVVLMSLPILGIFFSCSATQTMSNDQLKTSSDQLYSGFHEQQISENEYVLDYNGSSLKYNKIEDISMLKAAELADKNGYKNFVIEYEESSETIAKSKKMKSNKCNVKLYNDVPGKYEVYYSAVDEKDRLEKVYKLK